MANLHLVTGYAGSAHVTAADHGSLNAAIVGTRNYVLNRGNKFAATVISANCIRIADGDIMMNGRHVRLSNNGYTDVAIENGTADHNRNDLIVCRYTKDGTTGVEECNLVVIKGTETTGGAPDPDYNEGNILDGDDLVDFPLYRVPLAGLDVEDPEQLFSVYDEKNVVYATQYVDSWESFNALVETTAEEIDLHATRVLSVLCYFTLYGMALVTIHKGRNGNGEIMCQAEALVSDGSRLHRYCDDGVWSDWTDVAATALATAKTALAAANASANLQVYPAIESTAYPGCYYRTVDSATEWINPPLVADVEYRTAERYNSKPVYVKRKRFALSGTVNSASSKLDTNLAGVTIIDFSATFTDGNGDNYPLAGTTSSQVSVAVYSTEDGLTIAVTPAIQAFADGTADFAVKYIK